MEFAKAQSFVSGVYTFITPRKKSADTNIFQFTITSPLFHSEDAI